MPIRREKKSPAHRGSDGAGSSKRFKWGADMTDNLKRIIYDLQQLQNECLENRGIAQKYFWADRYLEDAIVGAKLALKELEGER